MDLAAARNVSGTTLLVAAQLRLPLCALLRWILLGRGQTALQWLMLLVISLLCVGHVVHDLGDSVAAGTVGNEGSWIAASPDQLLVALPLILGKSLISCGGAVHAEYFLQSDAQEVPLSVTQVHFKSATMLGALIVAWAQGLLSSKILASSWDGHIFPHFPPGVQPGDARTPFFGGWDSETWLVVSTVFFPGSSISCNKGCRSLVSKCFQGPSAGNRSTWLHSSIVNNPRDHPRWHLTHTECWQPGFWEANLKKVRLLWLAEKHGMVSWKNPAAFPAPRTSMGYHGLPGYLAPRQLLDCQQLFGGWPNATPHLRSQAAWCRHRRLFFGRLKDFIAKQLGIWMG